MSLRSAIRWLVTGLAVALWPIAAWASSGPPDAEAIVVPGGTAAVARLLGTVDESPERFVVTLNQVLLTYTQEDGKWESNDTRVRLVQYLRDLRELEAQFSTPIELALEPKPLRKRFRQLCDFLGYGTKTKKGELLLIPKSDEAAARRQRLANALGWDLPAVASALNRGERVKLEIAADRVPSQLPLDVWKEALDREVPPQTALEILAKNQRLSLLLDASRRLSSETTQVINRIGWRWLYENAAPQLFRYAAAIRVEGGRPQLPGGSATADAWSRLLEVQPDETTAFVKELLTRKRGRAAFLWHALAWTPPEVVGFYLGGAATTRPERKLVRKLFGRLDETTRLEFDRPRGGDLGFGTFVRSIPVSEGGEDLALPGGLGLWFVAIRDDESPADDEGLARIVRKGLQRQLEVDEFLLRSLNEHVEVRGAKRPVLPRLIRTSRQFAGQPSLLTPQNVILLARASDNYPAVLGVLDELQLSRPEVVQQYLLAVAQLDTLAFEPRSELLLLNFQGGIEWLRAMARVGKVPPDVLEDHLERWSRIHRQHGDPDSAAPAQLAWIDSLLESLPEAAEGDPGRGPWERAFVQALVEPQDPQSFEWKGLEYRGRRGRQLASRLAEHLQRQGIPPVDDLRSLHASFTELERAASAGDIDSARQAVATLRGLVRDLGGDELAAGLTDKELRARLLPIDRQRLLETLLRVGKANKPKKLTRQMDNIAKARQLLARELRPFLLAPAYLLAMGEADNVLLADPNLVRKHLFVDGDPWRRAAVKRVEGSELGAHVSGHLGSLAEALAAYSLIGTSGSGAQSPFRSSFYQDFISTRWTDLSVDTARLVAAVAAVGRQVRDQALGEIESGGPALDFIARRLPVARLTRRDGRLSESELVAIGLAALDGDEFDGKGLRYLDGATRAPFDRARLALDDTWRDSLNRAGTATPHLNGRTRPWIGTWPPYEAVEIEALPDALYERLALDLKLVVIDYLGRNSLPGVVGKDLMAVVLPEAVVQPRLANWRDWQGYLRWLDNIDDDYLDEKLRQCMRQGLYTIADS